MRKKYAMIFSFLALSLMITIPVSPVVSAVKDRIITIETRATDGATHGYGNVDRGGNHSWSEDTWFEDVAHAHVGYYLAYWEYDGIELPNTENITVLVTQGTHTLVAVFSPEPTQPPPPAPPPEPIKYALVISTISCDGTALPIDCVTDPMVGTYLYEEGQTASVTATASDGWFFSNWVLDDVNKTENAINVEMTTNHTLAAVFNPIPILPPPPLPEHTITIIEQSCNGVQDGFGYVSPNGTSTYYNDVWCNYTAYPAEGWFLQSWNYNGQEFPPSNNFFEGFLTEGSHTLIATFNPIPILPPPPTPTKYPLVISATSCDGSSLSPGCVTSPAVGTSLYEAGQITIVTATASDGWAFSHWLLDDVNRTENPTSIEMSSNHTLVAIFNPIPAPPPPPPSPPPLPESKNLTVYVVFCGDTRGYWKVALSYFEAPTSLTIKISTTSYAEILKYFGTATFTAPYRNTVYSEAYYTETQYYMAGHDLAIGVIGVPSIQVTLVP